MKKLVIVESPAKAKSIQSYLGKDYVVRSSKGHVVDLPKSGLGVDVDNDFQPEYTVTKPAVVKELKQAYKDADVLVLAVDPDREGEAIGWHVAQELGAITPLGNSKKGKRTERIVFTEITKQAVQEAAANPRQLDMDLVNAQQARRVLDRLVGYKLSPLLWKKIRYGLSAGRVQSVAVRLIVDRERERDKFKPEEYWSLVAYLDVKKHTTKPKINLVLKSKEDLDEEEFEEMEAKGSTIPFTLISYADKKVNYKAQSDVKKVAAELETAKFTVQEIESKQVSKYPSPPFTTSTLQQVASGRLGFTAKRTMQTAQKLYEAGLITYMRTDSVNMSPQAVSKIRSYVQEAYGKEFLPSEPIYYKTKSKVAQEAHEAIRSTEFNKSASKLGLTGDEARLYDLIRSRAIAAQMSPAKLQQDKVLVEAGKCGFQSVGRQVVFPGYLKIYTEQVTELELPRYEQGQILYATEILGSQHFTQPPARFSEASLVKELERLGIGRPSTYAPIIQTIQQRKYVEKLGAYFMPTDIGYVVTDLLVKHFSNIVDTGFTSDMEDQLDDIASGKQDWVKMLKTFYGPFSKDLASKEKNINREDFTVLGKSDYKCPECGKPMVIKLGKFGKFLSCSNFPDCKGMLSLEGESEEDIEKKVNTEEFKSTYLPAPQTEDGKSYLLKRGRFGEFWAHPDYPKVKDARPLELLPARLEEMYGEIPKTKDGRPYLLKKGRFGEFWAHPDYPTVKDIVRIKRKVK